MLRLLEQMNDVEFRKFTERVDDQQFTLHMAMSSEVGDQSRVAMTASDLEHTILAEVLYLAQDFSSNENRNRMLDMLRQLNRLQSRQNR